MTLKVYAALDYSDSVAALISDALQVWESAGNGRLVNSIDDADVVVSSPRGMDELPDSSPEGTGLLQLLDCGSGGRFGDYVGLKVANMAPALGERAARWATSQVQDAYDEMTSAGLGRPIRVGVIGIGNLGTAIVRAMQAGQDDTFESIVVADIRTPRQGLLRELGVRRSTLDLLLSTSDVVLVAVHRGPTTDPLLGARELRLMGGHAWVVNLSGDGVVDESGSDASSIPAKIVERPITEMARDMEGCANRIASAVISNLRRYTDGADPVGLVEQVTYPSAGDPAFWSSQMSPVQLRG